MYCQKCCKPMYYPSQTKLCPTCEEKNLDQWIAEQEAAERTKPLADSEQNGNEKKDNLGR